MPRVRPLLAVMLLALAAPRPAAAQPARDAEAWLASLQDDVAADLRAGHRLEVTVHVPLCDNDLIRCGNSRLGDGEDLAHNLYWATSGGFLGWFGRKGSGWKQVRRTAGGDDPDILETRVWRRRVRPAGALRARGVTRPFDVDVVVHAWRGEAIQRAMARFASDLFGSGGSRLVAFVGHNGWMDVGDFAWPAAPTDAPRRGVIAIACITEDYLVPAVPSERRVPLLFTRSLLFAGAHALEGAVSAFAAGASLAGVREGAVRAYAAGQKKPLPRVRAAFTNPADRKWKAR
ncbi:MAG TPA: hypothetical protein VMZ28_28070 [Kofleriaceae bacterium]|nr:hypothetical protein [Kofleriaceae bacterium]